MRIGRADNDILQLISYDKWTMSLVTHRGPERVSDFMTGWIIAFKND